jgi:RNA polymerase sigma factor (sigma-70 family)
VILIDLLSLPSTDEAPPQPLADARELLSRFAATGEQEAFEEVVRRYGGMVFNLCYEVTGNRHDAEDAVQAAFLSLAVQTRSGTPVQAIGPWLQQVARRMSLDINRSRKRRKNREEKHGKAWETRLTELGADGNGGSGGHGNPQSAAGWEEVRQVVQEELGTLPPKYRMPLILHYYGGMSRDEMARELNCRPNTLGVRLHRGREMLAKKLAKRGVVLSGVIIGVLMTEVCRSIVTERLVSSTAQAAVWFSAGHPYACGLVSPQIAALAQRASYALANAKIRFAASLALLAGGAAAAGAQVVSQVGSWSVGGHVNWDIGRFFRDAEPRFKPPVRISPRVQGPSSSPSKVVADNTHPGVPSPRTNMAVVPHVGLKWPHLQWEPVRGNNPAPVVQPNGVANVQPRPIDRGPILPPPNNGTQQLPPPDVNVASGGGGGGGGDINNGNKGGSRNRSTDVADNKSNGEKPEPKPDRGGVKPDSSDVASNGPPKPKPVPKGGTSPDQSDGVAKQFPIPPRFDLDPKDTLIGPIGPVLPAKKGDAEKIEAPQPAGDGAPHGGFLSDDVLHITTDYNPAGAESFEQIQGAGIGPANFHIGAGETVTSKQVIVGHLGTGVATQTGGLHTVDSLYLGVIKTGHGLYQLSGGELSVTATPDDPDAFVHTIEVGSAGEGVFLIGDAHSTGRITQSGQGLGTHLTVGAIRSANGTLRGWGTVGLTGHLSNNGRIVGDGYGVDRTLDLTGFASVGNDFSNRDIHGWFAVNHGSLALPAIAVASGSNTYTWGGNAEDEKITLDNSARMTLNDVKSAGAVKIALQALDRSDLPTLPSGHHFIGIWSFDAADGNGDPLEAAGGMDLLVRYDDALAAEKGLSEGVLKLWKYDGQWERLDFDPTFVRNGTDHTLFVHTDIDGMSYFAVSAPEPGSMMMISLGAGMWLGKRRRRKA